MKNIFKSGILKSKKNFGFLLFLGLLLAPLFFVTAWNADNGDGTFTNPILNADYPDPAVIRVGSDFYMVSSTFVSFPAVVILHSKDLVNWEIIGYVANNMGSGINYVLSSTNDRYGKGCWAPTIAYRNGTFYIGIYESGGRFTMCTSTNPAGPYTASTYSVGYHDPGLLIDDDGTGYLCHEANDVRIAKLSSDYKSVASDTLVMRIEGVTGSYLVEGTHMYKRNGYYYIFRNSTPPESYSYCLRSKNIYGPYEMKIILNGPTIPGGSQIHQGGPVDTPNGEWWFIMFQDGAGLGRRDILIPMQWQSDWPVLGDPATVKTVTIAGVGYQIGNVPVKFKKPNVGTFPMMTIPNTDEFNAQTFHLAWQWNHLPDNNMWTLNERPGYLRLKAKNANNLWRASNTLTQRVEGPDCQGTIELDTSGMKDGDTAGICLLNIPYGFIGVNMSGGVKKIVANIGGNKDTQGTISNGPNLSSGIVYLKAKGTLSSNVGTFFYSLDNVNFTQLGGSLNMPFDLGFFQGDKLGIFNFTSAATGGYADINWFHYYTSAGPNTPIPSSSPTPTPTPSPTPTPLQNPIWTGGPYTFNGSTDYVDVPDGITNSLSDFTVACWVKLNTLTNWVRIFDFGGDTNVFMMLTPQSGTTGYPYFAITTSGNSGEQGLNGTSALPTGTWQHLAVVKSGNTGILYINKQEVARNTSMTLRPVDLGNTTNNYIGRSQWSQDPYYSGNVEQFKLYNRALTTAEVAALPAVGGVVGDVNGDGNVTIVDAMLIAQYVSGLNPAGFISANADVNCDNVININDALLVARFAAGLITKLGC